MKPQLKVLSFSLLLIVGSSAINAWGETCPPPSIFKELCVGKTSGVVRTTQGHWNLIVDCSSYNPGVGQVVDFGVYVNSSTDPNSVGCYYKFGSSSNTFTPGAWIPYTTIRQAEEVSGDWQTCGGGGPVGTRCCGSEGRYSSTPVRQCNFELPPT